MKKLNVWIPFLFSVIMVIGMWTGYRLRENVNTKGFFKTRKVNKVQEVLDLVDKRYVDSVNTDSLSDEAIQGVLSRLDPHSYYIPSEDREEMNEDLQGNFQGIGVEFLILEDTVNVTNVLPGGPSDQAGLQIGDRIIRVNHEIVAGNGITSDKIKKVLKGPEGSLVSVDLFREGITHTVEITRGAIPLPAVDASYIIAPKIGYLRINKFSRTTYEEFLDGIKRLNSRGQENLILDLRGNGGGIVDEAVQIADEFLGEDKLIVYTEGRFSPRKEYRALRPGLFEKGKLAVLVDEGTASASEILTGALQDWDRGTIIGRRTFGKGLVQEPFQLSDGSELRLTIARYYTPMGRSIQKPYDRNKDHYNEEVYERYHDGEMLHGDSTMRHAGPVFKTAGGRKVYGGGGIDPDIFVPLDTSNLSGTSVDLYSKGSINSAVYNYFLKNHASLKNYSSPMEFDKSFKDDLTLWNVLSQAAKSDSIELKGVTAKGKSVLLDHMKAMLARMLWRSDGYFQIVNLHDPVVGKALEELQR